MSFQSRFCWIGRKVGMTNVLQAGKVRAITLVEVFDQHVLSKVEQKDCFVLRVGVDIKKKYRNSNVVNLKKLEKPLKKLNKPQIIELEKLGKPLCSFVKEFKVTKEELSKAGDCYGLDLLAEEKFLDVTGKNIGKGFAGGMKRWNFQGAGASHGTSLTHRAIGSTGTREKSWPNKKMPGRLGNEKITIQSLPVVEVDRELNLVALHGSIPGKSGSVVILRKAIKKQGVEL